MVSVFTELGEGEREREGGREGERERGRERERGGGGGVEDVHVGVQRDALSLPLRLPMAETLQFVFLTSGHN